MKFLKVVGTLLIVVSIGYGLLFVGSTAYVTDRDASYIFFVPELSERMGWDVPLLPDSNIVAVSELDWTHALRNLLTLFVQSFLVICVWIVGLVGFIPVAIYVMVAEDILSGIMTLILAPIALIVLLLFPFLALLVMLFQSDGTTGYYILMSLPAVVSIVGGYLGGGSPVYYIIIIVVRRS